MKIKQIEGPGIDDVVGLFNQYRMFYRQPSDPGLARKYIQERLDNMESVLFVAFVEENGHSIPVGFTQLYPNYSSIRAVKNWILNDLFVDTGYRKRNIGTALIRRVLDFAREQGAQSVELTTATDNFIAQGIYERIGFRQQLPDNDFINYSFFIDFQN
ncbi:N-acetyltransferase family protein [Flavitalea flava]